MKKNIGSLDKIVRVIIGLGLIVAGIILAPQGLWWIALVAVIPFGTALLGTCPVYLPFGITTIKVETYKGN